MSYDSWNTTPPDWDIDCDDDRDDERDASPTFVSQRCLCCAGTGWKNGVVMSSICESGCAGSGTRLVIS